MLKSRLYFTFILSLVFLYTTAQLSGNYTVGGVNPDYSSLQSASNSLQQQGIAGPVTFMIRAGNYSGFTLGTFSNANGSDTVTFKAENEIAASVIINSPILLQESERVHLNKLTITGSASSELSTLFFDYTNHCLVSHCNISNSSGSNYDDDEALIKIEAPWEGSYARLTFDSCIIYSPLKTLYVRGEVVNVYINRSILTGCFKLDDDATFFYNYNIINILDYRLDRGSQRFTGNEFHIPDTSWTLYTHGKYYNNIFHCKIDAGSIFINNIFKKDVRSGQGIVNFRGNIFEKGFNSTFCHGSIYSCNVFRGPCSINSDGIKMWNNYFFSDLECTHGPGQWVEFNNFHPNSTASFMYVSATIRNNNFGNLIVYQPSIALVSNNNFVNGKSVPVNFTGENPLFYDPGYIDPENDLHATNPALIYKSSQVYSSFRYDSDSVRRNNIASIGANEICFNLPFDTVHLFCGDSLCMDMCIENFDGYFWTPSYLFTDSTNSSPVFYPREAIEIKLNHQEFGVVDSLVILMLDSLPVALCTYTALGNDIQFINKSGCADSYLWDFGDGTTSNLSDPLHTYQGTGYYEGMLTAYNSYGSDSFNFNINIVNPTVPDSQQSDFNLSPVPASVDLFLQIPRELLPLKLNIIDMQGITHISDIVVNHEHHVNIKSLPNGMYIAIFTGSSGQYSRKVIKISG